MSSPLISVVIPAFNAEAFIAEAIESVLAQTYTPIEMIVVDDGSSDGTSEIVSRYPQVRLIRKENGGPAPARNRGFAESVGEAVTFLDSDDAMFPDKLEVQAAHLAENPQIGVVIGAQELVIEPGTELPFWIEGSADQDVVPTRPPEVHGEPNTYAMSMLVRREVFEAVGDFDREVQPAEDIDWVLRATEAEVGITQLQHLMVRRRVHADSLTQDAEASRRGTFRAFKARIERHRERAATD